MTNDNEDWRNIPVPEVDMDEPQTDREPLRNGWGVVAVAVSSIAILGQLMGRALGLPLDVFLMLPLLWIPTLILGVVGVIRDGRKMLSIFSIAGSLLFGSVTLALSFDVWLS